MRRRKVERQRSGLLRGEAKRIDVVSSPDRAAETTVRF